MNPRQEKKSAGAFHEGSGAFLFVRAGPPPPQGNCKVKGWPATARPAIFT